MPMLPPSAPSRQAQRRSGDHDPIVIGVVNNMPDAALRTTERQFRELLSAASHNVEICLRFFSLPELPRSDAGRAHVSQHYEDIRDLWTSRLDGLIVTGTEPRAPALADEPYWPTLTKLIDWAEDHTISTAWSCLAAHAVVQHIDGIGRYAFPKKLSGVFECRKATEHTLVVGAPPQWFVPHSRHNDLPQEALIACGYHILSRLPDAGADMFAKRRKSLFFFLQGHPEYDPGALLREYRRDVGRFLAGESGSYPEMPRGYFSEETAAELVAFRQEALRSRGIDLAPRFPAAAAEAKLAHAWHGLAVCIYANWLSYLAKQKCQSLGPTKSHDTPSEHFEQNVTA
jgi:homoserine O-succinyltransferase/O-acetyltransferase